MDEKTTETTSSNNGFWKKDSIKSIIKEILIFLGIAIFVVLPFRTYIAEPYLVDGKSMYPTFNTSDYLIVNKMIKGQNKLKRGDVIVFEYPNDTSKNFIKRIIALPGETITIINDKITITNTENPNGFTLDEPYIKDSYLMKSGETVLSGDEYFVMGDNRPESFDSRSWGPLSKKHIIGKPILQLFPFSRVKLINHD